MLGLRKKAILKRLYNRNPLWVGGHNVFFKNRKTGDRYSYILGSVSIPGLKKPGFALMMAADLNQDSKLRNPGTGDRYLRVLAEIEESDFKTLVKKCISLREKWTADDDILRTPWESGPLDDSANRLLVTINQKLRETRKAEFYLGGRENKFFDLIRTLYENRQALDLNKSPLLKLHMEVFKPEYAMQPNAEGKYPVIAALAYAVYMLTAMQPWSTDWWQHDYHDHSPWDEASFLTDESDMWSQPGATGNRIDTIEQEQEPYDDPSAGRYDGFEEEEYGTDSEDDGGEMPTMDDY